MAFYLGIDGGGTKTRCILGDETTVLATAVSGGCNVVRMGEAQARESISAAVRQACATANIVPRQIDGVCIGAAGAARPEGAAKGVALFDSIDPQLAHHIEVVGDSEIALEAAFGAGPGAIAISGTGSIVYGRDATGVTARAGGWGFAISDEGSGQWIGRHAIAALLRARDEGQDTRLTGLIMDACKVESIDELIQFANSTPPPEFPRLFPVVVRASDEHDSVARELLGQAGKELAVLAAIVLRRLSPRPPYVPVAMTGSVFRQSEEVRRVFYNQLEASFPGVGLRQESVEPVMGALARARKRGQEMTAPGTSVV